MYKSLMKVMVIMSIFNLTACQNLPPIRTVESVEIDRFMGDWFVIAAIPTPMEKDPYSPVESYRKNADGSIATTFTYRQGSFDGPLKSFHPTGYIVPETGNAEWKMQFIWPFKAEYLIAYLDADYQQTIVARNKRDYVWLMARKPHLSDADYQAAIERIRKMGYETDKLVKFPQKDQ